MFVSQAHHPPPSSAGLLAEAQPDADRSLAPGEAFDPVEVNPWRLLDRLRPVKVEAYLDYLLNYRYSIAVLKLMTELFPARAEFYTDLARASWWAILADIFNLVAELDWFRIDWSRLNLAWDEWLVDPGRDKGRQLAAFLDQVPVQFYGWNTQSLLECRPMHLMQVLLYEKAEVGTEALFAEAEIYDGLARWGSPDRAQAWTRLHQIEADPGLYPPAVRWLPELGRWVCGRTQNPLLDQSYDPRSGSPYFTWRANDLAQLRSAWSRAKPVIEQKDKLLKWYQDDPGRLASLAKFLMDKGFDHDYDEQLDWA